MKKATSQSAKMASIHSITTCASIANEIRSVATANTSSRTSKCASYASLLWPLTKTTRWKRQSRAGKVPPQGRPQWKTAWLEISAYSKAAMTWTFHKSSKWEIFGNPLITSALQTYSPSKASSRTAWQARLTTGKNSTSSSILNRVVIRPLTWRLRGARSLRPP